jgi:hypothetical protein
MSRRALTLLRVVLSVAAVVIGLAVVSGAAWLAWRLRHRHTSNALAYPTGAQIRTASADFESRPRTCALRTDGCETMVQINLVAPARA